MEDETYSRYEERSILRFGSPLKVSGGKSVRKINLSTQVSLWEESVEAYTEITGVPSLPFDLRKDYSGKDFYENVRLAEKGHKELRKRIAILENQDFELNQSILAGV